MDLSQKTPFAVTITEYIQNRMESNQQSFGLQLPARVIAVEGAIVTVNFEIDTGGTYTFPPVTCAIAESTYVRLPVQVGDYGVCIAADTRLGGINGLGQGLAPLTTPFNLGGLMFVPLGNKNWSSVDPNAVNINAPNGVVLRDTNNNCTVTLVPSGVTVIIGSTEMVINNSGVTITGNLVVHGSITGDNGFYISNSGSGATMQITGNITQTGNFTQTGSIASSGNISNSGTLTNNGKNVGSTHEHSGVQPGSGNTGAPI